ncbi:MAG TPA: T9SS type A sorting domain-containing protein [Flavisolibacter sp.]|nr:T9SS type A sorting domain-containing protein [Flavisolibacter sp.]
MKTTSTLLCLLLLISVFTSNATNYTNSGNQQAYNLNTGDTLRVVNGTYKGNINTFPYGAVIIVSATATFQPAYINSPNGKIINYGICDFNSLGTSSFFKFENFNLLNVKGDLNLYDGHTQTWTNNLTATIKISGNFSMQQAVFTNLSTMTVGGNFAMYSASSSFLNRGVLTVTRDLSVSAGTLDNENRIVTDKFNAWGGTVINEGSIQPKGDMVFSSGTEYTNKCLMITNAGFTNYGTFNNNGMLWVGRTGTNNDHFYNSGTFTNSSTAVVRAAKLTNYSLLAGGGGYYITGETYTSGVVGTNSTTTDVIKVYDVTRTNSSRIFDTQWGSVGTNVVYSPFAQPDTNNVNYEGCAASFRMDPAQLLPVEWNFFTAKLQQNIPVLAWSAQFEANMKFEVERSFDNAHFVKLGEVFSNNTKQYSFTDEKAGKGNVVYYRIKATGADGAVKYTETKSLKIAGVKATATVYPNPVRNIASVQFQSEKTELMTIRITNTAGQQMIAKQVSATKGLNTVSFTEAAQWKAGVYFVEMVQQNNVVSTERFIKQ